MESHITDKFDSYYINIYNKSNLDIYNNNIPDTISIFLINPWITPNISIDQNLDFVFNIEHNFDSKESHVSLMST